MMYEEKPKNEEKRKNDEKQYQTEWSFSFADLGDRINEFVRSLGASGDEAAIKTERFTEALGDTASARIRLDMPAGEANIKAASGDVLIDADITYIGEIEFAVTGEQDKQVTLSQKTQAADWVRGIVGWMGSQGKLRWDVALSPDVPLLLDIHSGVGKSTYDLSKLDLTGVEVHVGTGEAEVFLAPSADVYRAVINGGIGEMKVHVPANTSLDMKLRAGTGEINLDIGDNSDVYAEIRGGIGETNIRLPYGAAVRVEAKLGIGDVNVPKAFTRLSGSSGGIGKSGVWESPNYESAARRIHIMYDGGVGELNVK